MVTGMNVIQLRNSQDPTCSWINPTPQSVRFLRPLSISFEKEDDITSVFEYERLKKEINNLRSHKFILSNGKEVSIFYEVYQTMFDGKCVNALVKNPATSRCPMCLNTTHQFNSEDVDFTPDDENLLFG